MFHRILFLVSTLVYQVSWSIVCTVDWENSSPDFQTQPPCPFNALCTCSNPGPNLGLVQCLDSPMDNLPSLNSSTVYILRLENNGLRVLDESRFVDTGMWRLQIRQNLITRIPKGAFDGLHHSLRELDLRNNQLHFFPREAVRSLVRLKELDLTGNKILSVKRADFQGLERTLTTLGLSNNALSSLEQDTFSDLAFLEWLDLSENRLTFLAETSFHSGASRLKYFNLADNALTVIPYGVLALMKSLRTADLSRNRIISVPLMTDSKDGIDSTMSAALLEMSGGLKLETLNLNDNQIETLHSKSFRHFSKIKHLSLSGNPLKAILEDSFIGTSIEELVMNGCDLEQLSPNAFNGLQETLNLINLAHNLLTGSVIGDAIINMTSLVNVSLNGNPRSPFNLESLSNSKNYLQEIHLESAAEKSLNLGFDVQFSELDNFKQLRTLGLSHFPSTKLSDLIFQNLSPTIEEIIMKGSNLKTLDQDSFKFTPRLKRLDISSNNLIHVEKNIFKTVGRSMESLIMGDAFATGITNFPDNDIFEYLENLKELDLSNNQLVNIPSTAFNYLTSLQYLNLQDNAVTTLTDTTFKSDLHESLTHLKLSINRIERLESHTFNELSNLRYLYLDDNDIVHIEQGTFASLKRLEYLDLRGNSMTSISKFAFQDLPNLGYLNIARNRLELFPLEAFDQVGTMSSMKVDVSRNAIQRLTTNASGVVVNIKHLDLSYNNVSIIDSNYFDPIKDSIMELFIDHNNVRNITKSMFGDMLHLRVLRLDDNQIDTIEEDSFEKLTALQSVALKNNRLTILHSQLFHRHTVMRHLDLSNNRLQELPEDFLSGTPNLERLKLSNNRISHFPDTSLTSVSSSLRHLDLSYNQLRYLPKDVLKNILPQLHTLNLANNELKNIEDGTLGLTQRLHVLDLSGNPLGNPLNTIVSWTESTIPLQLECLNLANVSMTTIPDLNFPNILRMNLSHNSISFISLTSFRSAQDLHDLDLSYNRLTTVPLRVWPTVSRLVNLNLAFNPIQNLMNESFLGLNVLDEINIQGLNVVRMVQSGVFLSLKNLRTLHTEPYHKSGFDLVHSMSYIDNLRHLHVYFNADYGDIPFALRSKTTTTTTLPSTLTTISIRGIGFKGIVKGSLERLRNRNLHLTVINTTITSLEFNDGQLGAVRKLRLDVSYNGLVALADPSTTNDPNGRGVFLDHLAIQGNRWQCNCDIGWIEYWMRRLRQKKCHRYPVTVDDPSVYRECQEELEELRLTRCYNLGNRTLIDVLDEDLECGQTSSIGHLDRISNVTGILLILFVSYNYF